MPFVIVTGGPGVGKTTLLHELARRGHRVTTDTARELIAERRRQGLPPRPDALAFAQALWRRDVERYAAFGDDDDLVFFDRSPLESIAMLHEASPLDAATRRAMAGRFRFLRTVFILPPWPEIHVTDAERDQTFDDCVRVHARIVDCYRRLGHVLHEVPPATPQARAGHVLSVLAPWC